MAGFEGQSSNPFTPVYVPSAEQSLEFIPDMEYTYTEKLKALWASVHDDEAGSSLDQRYIYGDNNPKNYRTGPIISAKEANERYPVDIPHTQDIYEAEARFMKRRFDKQAAYDQLLGQLDPFSSFVFGTAVDVTGNVASYLALNLALGGAGFVAGRALTGTKIAQRAASVYRSYKALGTSGIGRIGQFAIAGGLEESLEEAAISPFRGQMALESGRRYDFGDVAASIGEGLVGGALLGGTIGTSVELFRNRGSVYNQMHKFYNKAFSRDRAAKAAAKAELETSMGYVPNTEAIFTDADLKVLKASKLDEQAIIDPTIEPEISVDTEAHGGFVDVNTIVNPAQLEDGLGKYNVPLEANLGKGVELSNSKKLIQTSDAQHVVSFDTSNLNMINLDGPLPDTAIQKLSEYFQEKWGISLKKSESFANMSGINFLKSAIKMANSLDVGADHASEFNRIMGETLGVDGYTYSAGSVGENGSISPSDKHTATFVFNTEKLQVKAVEESKPMKQSSTVENPTAPQQTLDYYKKPEALQNFDSDIQSKIEEFKKLIESIPEGDEFADQEAVKLKDILTMETELDPENGIDKIVMTKEEFSDYMRNILACMKKPE